MTLRFLLTLTLLLFSSYINAQAEMTALKLGEPISKEIKSGENHNYVLTSTGNQFIKLQLDQKGIDVQITVWNPDGTPITRFDSPNGDNGPEMISIMAESSGVYTFNVEPFSNYGTQGKYTFSVLSIDPFGETKAKRIDQLMSAWDTDDRPGASIAVVHNYEVVFSKGYGMANLEYDIPIETNSVFHTASISKQLTAFAILLLEEEGKLSLDDDIRKYISEVPDFGTPITLKHLATHTSGLRDQWELLTMAGWRMDDVITTDHVLKLVAKQKELNFLPGEEILYCNTGYTLLAVVVEEVSGMSFSEFTKQRIFAPLKMEKTLFYDDHEEIVKNRAYSYLEEGNGYKKSRLNYSVPGATSLFTTPEDLALWALNFEHPIIGTPESMKKMQMKGVLNNGDSTKYALGQAISTYNGLFNVSHGGADAGYRTVISRFPNKKFSVIVFGNAASFNPRRIADQITDLYLSEEYVDEKEITQPKTKLSKIKVPLEVLEKYVGDFDIQPGIVMTISIVKGKLFGEVTGQETFLMTAESDSLFKITDARARISFHANKEGKVNILKLHQSGSIMEAYRQEEFEPDFVDLDEFTGTFFSEELSTNYELVNHSNQLVAIHSRVDDITLIAVRKDAFNSNSWSFDSIVFARNKKGEITGFHASTNRVRKIWFEKR